LADFRFEPLSAILGTLFEYFVVSAPGVAGHADLVSAQELSVGDATQFTLWALLLYSPACARVIAEFKSVDACASQNLSWRADHCRTLIILADLTNSALLLREDAVFTDLDGVGVYATSLVWCTGFDVRALILFWITIDISDGVSLWCVF